MGTVRIAATVWGTESMELVANAIINLFPDAVLGGGSDVQGTSADIGHLRELLREQRIRDAARAHMASGICPEGITFGLNKQAALVGRVNFSEGYNPMGDIEVTIETDDPDATIDFLTGKDEQEEDPD